MIGFLKKLCRHGTCRKVAYDVAVKSARGMVRPDNQDSLLSSPERSLFCVADGMGGGQGGAEASKIACRCLDESVKAGAHFADRVKAAAESIRSANEKIQEYAKKARYSKMATTVAILALDDEMDHGGIIAYVGDSRVYRKRSGELRALTHDHTLAGELSRRPSMHSMIARMGWRENQLSHVLTRAVGIEPEVQPDWRRIEVKNEDVYLICSDGVYDMVDDGSLSEVLSPGRSSEEMALELERRILDAGAADNYTMIILRIKEVKG